MTMPKNDPLENLSAPKNAPPSTQLMADLRRGSSSQMDDLHDHLVRLQKQVNDLTSQLQELQETKVLTTETTPFTDKVWEAILMGAIAAALHPTRVLDNTDKAMQQMISRALRLADNGVVAAKAYKENQRVLNTPTPSTDPIRSLMDAP